MLFLITVFYYLQGGGAVRWGGCSGDDVVFGLRQQAGLVLLQVLCRDVGDAAHTHTRTHTHTHTHTLPFSKHYFCFLLCLVQNSLAVVLGKQGIFRWEVI